MCTALSRATHRHRCPGVNRTIARITRGTRLCADRDLAVFAATRAHELLGALYCHLKDVDRLLTALNGTLTKVFNTH
jgi:hypothetical protein